MSETVPLYFAGGTPTRSKDLGPCILFLVLYVILACVMIWRLTRRQDRTRLLARPAIFIPMRIALFIVRMIVALNGVNEGLLIAEMILLGIGFLFLVEPAVGMWKLLIAETVWVQKGCPPPPPPGMKRRRERGSHWTDTVALILRLALLAAIITGIVSSSQTADAIEDPGTANTVRDTRRASYILSMVVVGVLLLAQLLTYHRMRHLVQKSAFFLFFINAVLCIIAGYRLATAYASEGEWVRSRSALYIMQFSFEYIVATALLSISIPKWFPQHVIPTDTQAPPPQYNEAIAPPSHTHSRKPLPQQQGSDYSKPSQV